MRSIRSFICRFLNNHRWRLLWLFALCVVGWVSCLFLRLSTQMMFFGAVSPSGKQVITYTFDDRLDIPVITAHIRDANTGAIAHDLTYVGTNSGEYLHWLDDDNIIAEVHESYPTRLVQVQLKPTEKIIRDESLKGIVDAMRGVNGRPFHTERDIKKRELRFVENGSNVVARLSYGKNEDAYTYMNNSEPIVAVDVVPDAAVTANGEFFLSNPTTGTQTYHFDANTGEQIRSFKSSFSAVPNSNTHVWERGATGTAIFHVDDLLNPIALVPGAGLVVSMSSAGEVVIFELPTAGQPARFHLLNAREEASRVIPTENWQLVASEHGHLFVTTNGLDGPAYKLDLEENSKTLFAYARRGQKLSLIATLISLPILMIAFWGAMFRFRSSIPFVDVGIYFIGLSLVVMAWSRYLQYDHSQLSAFATQTLLGVVLAMLLSWCVSTRARYSIGIPVVLLGVTSIVSLYVWFGDSFRNDLVEMVLGGTLLVSFQVIAHSAMRRWSGKIRRTDKPQTQETQFSLLQIASVMAAAGVLFTCLRRIGFEESGIRMSFFVWTVVFTGTYAAAVVLAIWIGLRVANWFASGIAAVLTSAALGLFTFAVCRLTGLSDVNRIEEFVYCQPFFIAALSWLAIRACRRSGYRLVLNP